MKLADAHIFHVSTAHFPNDVRIYRRECVQIRPHVSRVTLLAIADRTQITDQDIHVLSLQRTRPKTWKERFFTALRAASVAKQQSADLYHFHDPELLLPMAKLGRESGKPVIFDVHECYSATIAQGHGLKGRVLSSFYRLLERFALRYISGVVSVTPQITGMYRYRVPYVALVRNYPDVDEIVRITPGFPKIVPGRLFFSGSLKQKSLFPLADAVSNLSTKFPEIHLQLAGHFDSQEFHDELISYWNQKGVGDRIQYLGRIPHENLIIHANRSAIGLVLLWPFENVLVGLPNKLFEYMAAGLPVLVSNAPNHREVVEIARCGIWCDSASDESIANAIETLLKDPANLENMRKNGRKACQEHFQMKNETGALLSIYKDIFNS